MYRSIHSSSDPISHRINSRNAKKLALMLVIGFTIYHGILHVYYRELKPFSEHFSKIFQIRN